MKALNGAKQTAGKKSPNKIQRRRNGLLAIVHIAKKDLGLDDAEYMETLGVYGVSSAGAMSVPELEDLVDYFGSLGFKKKAVGQAFQPADRGRQRMAHALHERIRTEAAKLENGESRFQGLVKKIAKVDDLRFCRNVGKLKQILKIITVYQQKGE